MDQKTTKKINRIIIIFTILAVGAFLLEYVLGSDTKVIKRNSYGEGKKTEEYLVTAEGLEEKESIQVETYEREYTAEETRKMFRKIIRKLDTVVLGENKSFDRVEKPLSLVKSLDGYPVQIDWELSSYEVLNTEGEINEKAVTAEGSMVELRGNIRYRDYEASYIRTAKIYPLTRTGADKLLYDIQKEVLRIESQTREQGSFSMPAVVGGKRLSWSKKKENYWLYFLLIGGTLVVYLLYHSREKVRQRDKKRKEDLMRDYPAMISKLSMLLRTGIPLRSAWEKIVEGYESQKQFTGERPVYEEMKATLCEFQAKIPEGEAYERFGKRCGTTAYIRFGALLSRNVKKGTRGLSELLREEAAEAFELRKTNAKRKGDEAGTKLLAPMLGMLAVVMIMVMVPAFLTMQL